MECSLSAKTRFIQEQQTKQTIQLTSCKRFDNNCYHLQCIAIVYQFAVIPVLRDDVKMH